MFDAGRIGDAFGGRVVVFVVRCFFLGLVGEFQQRVAFGDLSQFRFEFQLRQLQQPDRLLQLRREGQLLMKAKL